MPKRHKESNDDDEEESEFEPERESGSSEDESEDDDIASACRHESDSASSTDDCGAELSVTKSASRAGGKERGGKYLDSPRPRKKPKRNLAPDLTGPTIERKTSAGGYSHVESSKLLISRANKGNVPWNKGKNRNTTDRAKIAAGVRARNNAIAKKKREAYGLTEEEEATLKKRIKYVRERVRKARIEKEARQEGKRKSRLAWAKVERSLKVGELDNRKAAKCSKSDEESDNSGDDSDKTGENADFVRLTLKFSDSDNARISAPKLDKDESGEDEGDQEAEDPSYVANYVPRDFEWTPHDFDTRPYNESCPVGGPGGLVCCETCAGLYSQYMLSTLDDLERQKVSKVGKEVEQLKDFLNVSTRQLRDAVRSTRRKPIPIRRSDPAL